MNNTIFMFLLVSLLFSCSNQNDSFSSLLEQSEMLKEDPIAMNFFGTITASAKLLTESRLDIQRYYKITEPFNDICDVKKEVFEGNINMEKLARIMCQMNTAKKIFYEKYPSIEDMDKGKRGELFVLTVKKPIYDMELIKKNAKKIQID